MGSIELTFKAPIVFTYNYRIDIDELEGQDINNYIASVVKDMSYFADSMYQNSKEELPYVIEHNICLSSVQERDKKKDEFDF